MELLDIERSIITKYRKTIWSKFVKAIQEYELIKENDNIMVCISGGKDSFLLAKCIQELIKHGKFPFTAHYVVMDPGYSQVNRNLIEENAKKLGIPIEIFTSDIFDSVASVDVKGACYLCARMRRGNLYAKAKELGCNKIALGHHFDDVIETTLLSMLYGAEVKTMMPKLHSDNFKGIELIRPLFFKVNYKTGQISSETLDKNTNIFTFEKRAKPSFKSASQRSNIGPQLRTTEISCIPFSVLLATRHLPHFLV